MCNTVFALDKIRNFIHQSDRSNANFVEVLIHTKTLHQL